MIKTYSRLKIGVKALGAVAQIKIARRNVGARLAAPNEIAKMGRASPAPMGNNKIKMALGNMPFTLNFTKLHEEVRRPCSERFHAKTPLKE